MLSSLLGPTVTGNGWGCGDGPFRPRSTTISKGHSQPASSESERPLTLENDIELAWIRCSNTFYGVTDSANWQTLQEFDVLPLCTTLAAGCSCRRNELPFDVPRDCKRHGDAPHLDPGFCQSDFYIYISILRRLIESDSVIEAHNTLWNHCGQGISCPGTQNKLVDFDQKILYACHRTENKCSRVANKALLYCLFSIEAFYL